MKIKALTVAVLAILAAVLLVGCTSKEDKTAATTAPTAAATEAATQAAATSAQLELTAEELAKYNGKDGNPAYVAVDGVVYDVTNVPQWANGVHKGYEAGKDLTEVIAKSPHGKSVLQDLPIVGVLKAGG